MGAPRSLLRRLRPKLTAQQFVRLEPSCPRLEAFSAYQALTAARSRFPRSCAVAHRAPHARSYRARRDRAARGWRARAGQGDAGQIALLPLRPGPREPPFVARRTGGTPGSSRAVSPSAPSHPRRRRADCRARTRRALHLGQEDEFCICILTTDPCRRRILGTSAVPLSRIPPTPLCILFSALLKAEQRCHPKVATVVPPRNTP